MGMAAVLVWGPAGLSLKATCPPHDQCPTHASHRRTGVPGLSGHLVWSQSHGGNSGLSACTADTPDSVTEGVDQSQAGVPMRQPFSSSSMSLNISSVPVSTPNRNKPICRHYEPLSHLQNTRPFLLLWWKPGAGGPCGDPAGGGRHGAPSGASAAVLSPQPSPCCTGAPATCPSGAASPSTWPSS